MDICIPSKRASYHTSLKFLVKTNLLPETYSKSIHRSLIWKWKREPEYKYRGYELDKLAGDRFALLQEFAHNAPAQKVFEAYLNICKVIIEATAGLKRFQRKMREHKKEIVEAIENATGTMPLSNAIRCFNISTSTYYAWYAEVKRRCRRSSLRFCLKTFPQQLTTKETGLMQYLLLNEQFSVWPVASIAYYALREKLICASLPTWYKYARLLGINRRRKRERKKKTGIRADRPNAVWHADVTVMKLADNQKVYVYLLIDNYSRFIHSWRCSFKLSAQLRLETIKEATAVIKPQHDGISLIVDGGTENNNTTVEDWLANRPIHKTVALKDICLSNSMVEAMNRVLKQNYLYGKDHHSLESLQESLSKSIHDYNNCRPHISLKGLTPKEAYNGMKPAEKDFQTRLEESRISRLEINRENICNECLE